MIRRRAENPRARDDDTGAAPPFLATGATRGRCPQTPPRIAVVPRSAGRDRRRDTPRIRPRRARPGHRRVRGATRILLVVGVDNVLFAAEHFNLLTWTATGLLPRTREVATIAGEMRRVADGGR